MLGNLANKLTELSEKLHRQARITEDNIQQIVREIRLALLEADVALSVVKEVTNKVREQAIGQVVQDRLNPGQTFVKILLAELTQILGGDADPISFQQTKPIVILLAGLQGAGKTTTAAKLGMWLRSQKQRAILCSCDIYRPAAVDQLQTLCQQAELDFFSYDSKQPIEIATKALDAARLGQFDVCLIDTAGRTSVDTQMMDEIANIHQAVTPAETLLVVDAMTGQDAANTARDFSAKIAVTGVVLAKADSDARGGAALSIATIANCPIRFLGVGEKSSELEAFYPDRMAKRILGMGDILSAIELVEATTDKADLAKLQHKLKSKKGSFSLNDYRNQLKQLDKMGGVTGLLTKLPGMGAKLDSEKVQSIASSHTNKHVALINSMTPKERLNQDIINQSRKRRIAKGAGMEPIEVNRLLKQFKQMSKMMSKMSGKGGMRRMMQQIEAMQNRL